YFDGRVGLLADLARGLFAQKGTVPTEGDLQEFVRVITDEHERIMRRELPRWYCGGQSVYFTTCLIQPGHLPGNCLAQSAFPLLAHFAEPQSVMVLPSRVWPPSLVAQWQAAAPATAAEVRPTGNQLLTLTPAAAKQIRLALRDSGALYLRVAWVVAESSNGV